MRCQTRLDLIKETRSRSGGEWNIEQHSIYHIVLQGVKVYFCEFVKG
jgi:hypothetical protein